MELAMFCKDQPGVSKELRQRLIRSVKLLQWETAEADGKEGEYDLCAHCGVKSAVLHFDEG